MRSGLLSTAVAACGLLLAGPASAQGVKIGILNDQSGVYADYGGKWSFEAAKMAVEDFGGSVLGQKIEVISADHQNKPDLGTAIARRWYEVEGVDMITELTTSSVALAIHDLSKQMKKIDIVVGAATSRLTGDACQPYGFHWAYDTHALAVGTGGALVQAGGDTWFFMTADYAFGYALEKDTGDLVKEKGGKVVGAVRIPLVFGKNIWRWWVPLVPQFFDAPPTAVAWRGTNARADYFQQNIALYRLDWAAEADESPIIAVSIVSALRQPAPLLMSIDARP